MVVPLRARLLGYTLRVRTAPRAHSSDEFHLGDLLPAILDAKRQGVMN